MRDTSHIIRLVVKAVPGVLPLLSPRAVCYVWGIDPACKTQGYFQATIEHMVQKVYDGNMGGEFIDIMANLIQGQLTDAYNQAWEEDGNVLPLPDYLEQSVQSAILQQYDYVDQYYRDIVDARVDGTPLDPLLARASLWANRWTEAYNEAMRLIAVEMGGKLMWQMGATEKHCESCSQLDGIVAYASEWEEAAVKPQSAPNSSLVCGGWNCDCSLQPTDQRRSPNALDSIMNIAVSANG